MSYVWGGSDFLARVENDNYAEVSSNTAWVSQ